MEPISKIQEFVDYDAKGNAKVLRRSTLHPGLSTEEAQELKFNQTEQATPSSDSPQLSGSIRFFADFKRVKDALRNR